MLTRGLLVFSFLVFFSHLNGQPHPNIGDDTSRPESMLVTFNRTFPDHHHKKIRGRAYTNPYMSAREHQFFRTKFSMPGVLYTRDDTIICEDLFYDLHREEILVYVEALYKLIEIEKSFVEGFTLIEPASGDTFNFVRIGESGFHQTIFEGDHYALYKKHQKLYKQKAHQGRYIHSFEEQTQLVLWQGGKSIILRKNADLLTRFPEDKKALKKYLRKSRIKLRGVSDQQAQSLMTYLEKMYPGYIMDNSEK